MNRFFYPDQSATSQMVSDLASYLSTQGIEVAAVSSRQLYENASAALPAREVTSGVRVFRVWTTTNGRTHLIGRALDYATFCVGAYCRLYCLLRKQDLVVAKTDPPLLSAIAAAVVTAKGARLVNWSQDVFPEVAQASGVGIAVGVPGRMLRALRNWSWRRASRNVAVGQRMAAYMKDQGVPTHRVSVIHNWADGGLIRPLAQETNALRKEWGLEDVFVVGYSGNLGRAHEASTMVCAIEILSVEPGIRFLFIGGGKSYQDLRELVTQRRLQNVIFKPYQPRECLAMSLSVPDVHLISLRSEMEGFVVPSKFYGVAAAGRPIVFIGDSDGEISRLVLELRCGRTVAEGDGQALAASIRELRDDKSLLLQLGKNARNAFDLKFDKAIALSKWERLLEQVAQEG